jgi:hypothetical protein
MMVCFDPFEPLDLKCRFNGFPRAWQA